MWLDPSGGGGYIEPRVREERKVKWDKGLWGTAEHFALSGRGPVRVGGY